MLLFGHVEKYNPDALSNRVGDTLHTVEVDPRPSVGRLPNESRFLPGVPDGVAAPSQMSTMTALPCNGTTFGFAPIIVVLAFAGPFGTS